MDRGRPLVVTQSTISSVIDFAFAGEQLLLLPLLTTHDVIGFVFNVSWSISFQTSGWAVRKCFCKFEVLEVYLYSFPHKLHLATSFFLVNCAHTSDLILRRKGCADPSASVTDLNWDHRVQLSSAAQTQSWPINTVVREENLPRERRWGTLDAAPSKVGSFFSLHTAALARGCASNIECCGWRRPLVETIVEMLRLAAGRNIECCG